MGFFSYQTPKVVAIDDIKIVVFNFLLVLLVLSYIFVVQVGEKGGYTTPYPVQGSARMRLYEPVVGGCDVLKDNSCVVNIQDKSNYHYCVDYKGQIPSGQLQRPCKVVPAVSLERQLPMSISITTSLTERHMRNVCNQSLPNCHKLQTMQDKTTYYVAGVEDYTLAIYHSFFSSGSGLSGASNTLPVGKMLIRNQNVCKSNPNTVDMHGNPTSSSPCYFLAARNPQHLASFDEFSINNILIAADAQLDAMSGEGSTYRDAGMVLLLEIQYQNFLRWKIDPVTFFYNPVFQPSATYKYYEERPYSNDTNRALLVDHHSILIQAVPTGPLHRFNGLQLLLTVTSSLTLLGIVSVIINVFCMNGMYRKRI